MTCKAILLVILFVSLFSASSATRKLASLVQEPPLTLQYHNGPLLFGRISVNLIWYGRFSPSQRSILSDLVASLPAPSTPLSSSPREPPSVVSWWKTTEKYRTRHTPRLQLVQGSQLVDEDYSLGKSLTLEQIVRLASRGGKANAVNVVLTADDVAVDGFCMNRCGTHGWSRSKGQKGKFAYVWVGNSESQCPGMCAWPFHQPIYGPQTPPLVPPNGDVGVDGMVINVASLLAGAATNPFGNGYFQGPLTAPLEAASACPGIYGKGAFPGYAGNLMVDPTTGGSYNAQGANGRKYLLPALWDPSTSSCSPLV